MRRLSEKANKKHERIIIVIHLFPKNCNVCQVISQLIHERELAVIIESKPYVVGS